MDYRYADSAIVRPTSDGTRFDLVLFEGDHVLHIWGLTDGFTAPDAPIRDNWSGIEDINIRLADAKIAPSGANAWTVIGGALAVLTLSTALVAATIPAVIASRREPIRELRVP